MSSSCLSVASTTLHTNGTGQHTYIAQHWADLFSASSRVSPTRPDQTSHSSSICWSCSIPTVALGEQRCFLAERPGKGVGLWHGEQPIGCLGMVSLISQPKGMKHNTNLNLVLFPWSLCLNVTFSLHLSPHDCNRRNSTLCPRVNFSAYSRIPKLKDGNGCPWRSTWLFGWSWDERLLWCTFCLSYLNDVICQSVHLGCSSWRGLSPGILMQLNKHLHILWQSSLLRKAAHCKIKSVIRCLPVCFHTSGH